MEAEGVKWKVEMGGGKEEGGRRREVVEGGE